MGTDNTPLHSPWRWATSNVTTSMTVSDATWLLTVTYDEESWLISEHSTGVYGAGPSFLHALADFHAALYSHLDILERDDQRLSPHLQRQADSIRRLLS